MEIVNAIAKAKFDIEKEKEKIATGEAKETAKSNMDKLHENYDF
jgi:hypothetical protein